MMNQTSSKPEETEYLPYYGKYISLVADDDILTVLSQQTEDTLKLLRSVPESQADFRYAPDKWSIKELVGHVIDTERVFSYRALRFARNDKTALSGYEQDDYVRNASFDNCSLAELASELEAVRRSTIFFLATSTRKHGCAEAWRMTPK